jgi:AcrR family transcriptional regulator
MARRNDHSRDEIKDMVINAGRRIIVSDGLSGCSARKIAQEIGYTVGTLYNVFDNYDDILLHINADTLDGMYQTVSNAIDRDLSGVQAVKALLLLYLDCATEHRALWSVLFEYNLSEKTSLPSWYTQKIELLFSLMLKPMQSIMKDEATARTAALTLWAGAHGIIQLALTGRLAKVKQANIEILLDSLVENYLKGVL